MKNDIAALTDQITDAINSFAGTASKQARRGYKQARANAEQAVDDMSERGSAMMDAAQMPRPRSGRRWKTPSPSVRWRPWASRSASAS